MKRFIKTYTVKRHLQFTVVQDGDAQQFEVQRWAAEDRTPEVIVVFSYPAGAPERARLDAITEAHRLAKAEQHGRDIVRGEGA